MHQGARALRRTGSARALRRTGALQVGTSLYESARTYALNLGSDYDHPFLTLFFWGGGADLSQK